MSVWKGAAMSKPLLLAVFLLLLLVSAAEAQFEETDCFNICSSTSLCSTWCMLDGNEATCGDYEVCDPDPDGDGLYDSTDNCPLVYNPNQADCDGDWIGDVCDSVNATYSFAEGRNCWIRNRLHLWGSDTTWYSEIRYSDVSSCGSPDKWVKALEIKKD
jgi:hypothetical protein